MATMRVSVAARHRETCNPSVLQLVLEWRKGGIPEGLPFRELFGEAPVQLSKDLLLRLGRAHVVAVNRGAESVVLLVELIGIPEVVLRGLHLDLKQLLLDRCNAPVEICGGVADFAVAVSCRQSLQLFNLRAAGAYLIYGAVQRRDVRPDFACELPVSRDVCSSHRVPQPGIEQHL